MTRPLSRSEMLMRRGRAPNPYAPRRRLRPEEVQALEDRLTPEEAATWEAQIAQADAEHPQDGVVMRWPADELITIKEAAQRCGVDYQTFIRKSALKSALAHAT